MSNPSPIAAPPNNAAYRALRWAKATHCGVSSDSSETSNTAQPVRKVKPHPMRQIPSK
jgi:hypothetical protein